MKKILLFNFAFLLIACQSTLIQKESSYVEIQSKSSIEITQAVEVEANSARAFLQQGEVISHGQLNLYDINCEIEINTVSEQRQIIAPGIFNILAINQDESPIVMIKPIMVAAVDLAWNSDSPVDIKRYYHFKLSAQSKASQSQVRAVICRGAQDKPYQARLPTVEEMQQASGEYIKFNL